MNDNENVVFAQCNIWKVQGIGQMYQINAVPRFMSWPGDPATVLLFWVGWLLLSLHSHELFIGWAWFI